MRYLPPIRWRDVAPGTILLYSDGPHAVHVEPAEHPLEVIVYAEGFPPVVMPALEFVHPVELDEADAAAILRAAGLTITPKET